MPFCDICGKNVPRSLPKHKKHCSAFNISNTTHARADTDDVVEQGQTVAENRAIGTGADDVSPQTINQAEDCRKRRRMPTPVDENFDFELDFGDQHDESNNYSLYTFSNCDDNPHDDADDIDFLLEYYFDATSDDDVAQQASFSRIETVNGIQVINLQDPPVPSEKDTWNHRLSRIAHDGNFSRASHEAIIDFCNDWRTSNNYSMYI